MILPKISKDEIFMRRALELAELGRGKVHPNPLVGAVLVQKNRVIGEGFHERFGEGHAEVDAIFNSAVNPKGATLYCNLEPCAHFGKTPPCTDLILASKIRRVVIGMKDPNPLVSGRGIRQLRKAGIEVVLGVCQKEAEELNRDFSHWITKKTPYVIVKAAQSLDGKIATATGDSKWITEKESRAFSHELRASCDAILVGVNTILKDNPRLDARLSSIKKIPLKIVMDSFLKTPLSARIFMGRSRNKVMIVTTPRASTKRLAKLECRAEVLVVPEKKRGFVDWKSLLRVLGERGIVSILVEGGGAVIGSAIREKVVNEIYVFVAPKIIGGSQSISSVGGDGIRFLKQATHIKNLEIERLGRDILVRGRL